MAFDAASWQQKRSSVDEDFGRRASTMAYARFLSQQRGDRQASDYKRNFAYQQPRFTASYGQRGLTGPGVQSGVYSQGLNRFASDYQRGLADIYDNNAQEAAGYDMQQANLEAERQAAIRELEFQKQAEIAATAAALEAFKPYMTGG